MNKNEVLDKYYTKESIVKMLASYILYYQVSLGSYTYETIQDMDKTIKKIKELNLTLDPNQVLMIIFELILQYSSKEDFNNRFEKYLETQATLHSLNDFISNNKELTNKDKFTKEKQKAILETDFFNINMKIQYLKEYPAMHKHYNEIIDDKYVSNAREIISNTF
jgi:hypothetical protein